MILSKQEVANMAATWWADKVTAPEFDNGDPSFTGFLGSFLAAQLVKPVELEQREKFISILVDTILASLDDGRQFTLSVDYGPDGYLSTAAELAGIGSNNFPWKTVMWIDENHISVRCGYGAPEEMIYATKAYYAGRITSAKESIEKYNSGEYLNYIEDPIKREELAKERIMCIEAEIKSYEAFMETTEE